jgi:GT2 family glycosyltransferase
MEKHTILDIIFVNYNSTDFLFNSLNSVYKNLNGVKAQIHIVDNASIDEIDKLENAFPDINLIKNKQNIGFSAAVNKGLKHTTAEYVMLLNPDTLINNGLFATMLNYMRRHPEVGIIGPRILNSDGTVQGSARSFPDLLTPLFARTSPLTRFFPNNPISRRNILTLDSDGITPQMVDWVSGACMLVRRNAIKEVGYMDELFFMYWEDADWCRRMWDQGWKVVYLPEASILHYVGASSSTQIFKSIIQFHQSTLRLYKKYSKPKMKIFYPVTIILLMIRLLLALSAQIFQSYKH